jgi:hypothetical protein
MLRRWAHVILAALLHVWLLVLAHHIAGTIIELVRDEIAVTAYDGAKAIALSR